MIYIYSADKTQRHELSHATSLRMGQPYNDIGKFTLVLPADDYNIGLIEDEGILYDTATNASFIVKAIQYDSDNNRMTVNGYTANWLLNKRTAAVRSAIDTIESDVLSAVTANLRNLPIVVGEANGLEETAEEGTELYGGQLMDEIIPILATGELGNRMRWNPSTKEHIFEIYKGIDRTTGIHAVVFSEERGTAKSLVIDDDDSEVANVIYVPGKLRDDTEMYVTVGDALGAARREYWMQKSESQDKDESESDFRKRLAGIGAEQAAEMIRRLSFKVNIDPADYGTKYSLGDIVKCDSRRFDVSFTARVTSVDFAMDKNGTTTTVTLGEPVLTVIGELKLKR